MEEREEADEFVRTLCLQLGVRLPKGLDDDDNGKRSDVGVGVRFGGGR